MPPNADQIRISAGHLSHYVGNASSSLEAWVDELRSMADDPNNSMMGFRVFYDGEKGCDSTLNLAMSMIISSSDRATGAVARVTAERAIKATRTNRGEWDRSSTCIILSEEY